MTNMALSDCIRSTPSRTIGALLMVAASQLSVALTRSRNDGQRTPGNERAGAEPRAHGHAGAAETATAH